MKTPIRTASIAALALAGTWLCFRPAAAAQDRFSVERPKLVVGIVVDQMKFEYLPRFWSKFADDGFRRLVHDGYLFANHHYNYFPTYTGPGHASIYTGTTPAIHGIIANEWYDRATGKPLYVVEDPSVQTVGADDPAGRMSPRNLLSTTVTDELKEAIPLSKVVSLSIKDRGAILPGGHLADQVFWYDFDTGDFITSTWYMDELPEWAREFNDRNLARSYSSEVWTPLLPLGEYTESDRDAASWERPFDDEEAPVFPHRMNGSLSRIITSPFGDELLAAFAKTAIGALQLGKDEVTDFLAISFSPPDYVGHRFGPDSVEIEDVYLRLDGQIAALLSYLDANVGKGNYLLFLTSDHGVVQIPRSLQERRLPGGDFDHAAMLEELKHYLRQKYGEGEWTVHYGNQQIYLDRELIAQRGLVLSSMQDDVAAFVRRFEGVVNSNTAHRYATMDYGAGLESFYRNGYFFNRSGDVYIHLGPGWLDSTHRTSHGSPYSYDTHVPLIFFGWHVPQGTTTRKTVTPQIAPTISHMLDIPPPSGSTDQPLTFE
jgi:predicted AlkP superfamily pyrophosphatase or phosphodiesterase